MPKTIHQIHDKNGKPLSAAVSAPAWLLHNTTDIQVNSYNVVLNDKNAKLHWGGLFSEPQRGNKVDFFTTGEDYFAQVAAAISAAKSSVFIAGWQINYDVQLTVKKTLFHCLQDAIKGGATVYVMPWFSPKAGVDTGDFETMLAVYHLNAGAKNPQAFCLPAIQQGDQSTLGTFFAHHQKCVVIDNKKAYVGGIDLAYGRRDDANFSLKANGRSLNELYNTCVPAIDKLSHVNLQNCVTRAELLAAGLTEGLKQDAATFMVSPSEGAIAKGLDGIGKINDVVDEATGDIKEWWDNVKLFPDFMESIQDAAVDTAQEASVWTWQRLDARLQEQLKKLHLTGGANAANSASAVVAWLNNADLSRLPTPLIDETSKIIQALVYGVVAGMQSNIAKMPKRYEPLFRKVKVVPKSGLAIDTTCQPRMPWHDVQCCIEGPSVHDLSLNFTRRWNSVALKFEQSFSRFRDPVATMLLKKVGIAIPATPKAPRIQPSHLSTRAPEKKGGNWVQVLRSAPKTLLNDEAVAARESGKLPQAQNNCLKGMLKAIEGAQNFIYIEGQFFQSAHGKDGPLDRAQSGPMAALLDIRRTPGYEKFADLLEIRNIALKEIPLRMRWAKINELKKDPAFNGFMNDLERIFKNQATIEAMRLMGKSQENLKNPIGKALANRIKSAIDDHLPFHVYIVLPVHPEGTLDTLNIMTQIHLTMHSLVFGEHSLVNEIRRAILAARYRQDKKMSPEKAEEAVTAMKSEKLQEEISDDWKQYLTLLNLRNWDTIGGKPVTEQIYVHSKLLIADDRVAILGSANINDRSQWGDRDSELAVIVTDENQVTVKLDGVHEAPVGASIHALRRNLWEKLFGLKSDQRKATTLGTKQILDSPAAPATWKAIQSIAQDNSRAYDDAFWFIPRSGARPEVQLKEKEDKKPGPPPASIWPTWHYKTYLDHAQGGNLRYRMPFDALFWRKASNGDPESTWNVSKNAVHALAPVTAPEKIQGFIVALPIDWTGHENNQSGMNLSVLADNAGKPLPDSIQNESLQASLETITSTEAPA